MTGWVSLMGNGPPNSESLSQGRVEVVESRVCLHPQGVKELAEEAAGGRQRRERRGPNGKVGLDGGQESAPAIAHARPRTEGLRPVRNIAEPALDLLVHLAHRTLRLGRGYRANECHVFLLLLQVSLSAAALDRPDGESVSIVTPASTRRPPARRLRQVGPRVRSRRRDRRRPARSPH